MGDLSELIAAHITGFSLASAPSATVAKVKQHVLDTLAVGVAGTASEVARKMCGVVRGLGSGDGARAWVSGEPLPPHSAALYNGICAHALELDDTDRFAMFHPGAPIISAALAAGELVRATGAEFLTAVLLGYEIAIRIAATANPAHRQRGFHITGTVGTFGAAVAAARLLGLSAPQVVDALGIAGTQAAGLFAFVTNGAMTKPFHAGRAASAGVLAATMARAGITGPDQVLDGEYGFFAAEANGPGDGQEWADLGQSFRMDRVGIKPYSACRFCHAGIDAALALRSLGVTPGNLRRLRVRSGQQCFDQTGSAKVSNLLTAQFSTPFSMALMLTQGSALPPDYATHLTEPAVRSVMDRIAMAPDPDWEPLTRRIEAVAELVTGEEVRAAIPLPTGEPENPLSEEALVAKALRLAAPFVGEAAARRMVALVAECEALGDVRELVPVG